MSRFNQFEGYVWNVTYYKYQRSERLIWQNKILLLVLFLCADWTSTVNSQENFVWKNCPTWSSAQEWAKEQLAPNWQAPFKWYLAVTTSRTKLNFRGEPINFGETTVKRSNLKGIQAELRLVELRVEACLTRLLLDPSTESTHRVDLTKLRLKKPVPGVLGIRLICWGSSSLPSNQMTNQVGKNYTQGRGWNDHKAPAAQTCCFSLIHLNRQTSHSHRTPNVVQGSISSYSCLLLAERTYDTS